MKQNAHIKEQIHRGGRMIHKRNKGHMSLTVKGKMTTDFADPVPTNPPSEARSESNELS